jgi:hypothetical protein
MAPRKSSGVRKTSGGGIISSEKAFVYVGSRMERRRTRKTREHDSLEPVKWNGADANQGIGTAGSMSNQDFRTD